MKHILILLSSAFLAQIGSAQIALNEILASNATVNQDPDFQAFSDWLELHNASTTEADLTGWHLSDDADLPEKWAFPAGTKIPAKGFLLVWADGENTGLHTNFKLSAAGEKAILSDATGSEVDKITFGEQAVNISHGRQTDGTGAWGFFTKPTPGASNAGSGFYEDFTKPVPAFSVSGGFFGAPISLEIKSLSGWGTVRYTTDGAVPTNNSPVLEQPISISKTTVVRARIFLPNRVPGPVVTHTYFIGENFAQRGLAVLSLSGDPANFYGPDSGILAQNFKPLWEIPIHLEFYENDGLLGFHHDAGASVGGENSWILPQKLLNISSRKEYGGGSIAYQIFPENPRREFSDLILRTSGNDWSNTLFRDGMMQATAASTADLDIQPIRPVAAFINGSFYGIYNLREKQDKDYLAFHHGIATDSLDYIENDAEVKEGDDVAYKQMVALLTAGVADDAAFQNLEKICDTRDFTDYIQAEIFTANTSWGHNIALFRKRAPDARWRWLLHDFDRGFDLGNVGSTAMTWATATNGASWTNPPFGTLFLRKMLENEAFRERFVTRFADNLFVTWNPLAVIPRINRHADWIRNEVPNHVAKWAGTTSSYGNGLPSVAYWEGEVQELRDFSVQRNVFMLNDLRSFFSLGAPTPLTLQISDPAHGRVRLHDLQIPAFPWSGKYFRDRTFTLSAEAKPGFQFLRWERAKDTTLVLLPGGSSWKFSDADTAPASNWASPNFDDKAWKTGAAQLGYGDGDEATALSFGSDANAKTIAYFFRKTFDVADPAQFSSLLARMICDDGAVVYLNGQELWRYNLPAAPQAIGFTTLANTAITDAAESTWNEQILPISALKTGENLLAVEVHQSSGGSSDVSFDFELSGMASGAAQILSTNPVLDFALGNDATTLRAVFESDGSCGILPDTVRQNLTLTKACSPYRAAGDVVVLPNISLAVEAGVEIWFPEKSNLWMRGDLQINGTAAEPVAVKNAPGSASWGGIFLKNTTATSNFSHLTLEKATAGTHRFYFPAAISAYRANLNLDHLTLTQVLDNPIFARFSDVTLTNSDLKSVATGDGINVKQGRGRVENCTFTAAGTLLPDMDAIDFDGVTDGVVRGNVIHDFRGDNCDGLDIGEQCHNLQIEENFIYHCLDKGISVGQQSSASIRNNTIAYTSIGIALKDRSPATIDHCTIFGTQQGISAYEKNPGDLGGNGTVTNCIVSNTALDAYIADTLSSLVLENCLSGDDTLAAANGNLTADPSFLNPTRYDFRLLPGSPAMGSGSMGSALGASIFPTYLGQPQLMFSEILYADTLAATGEFLEILNPGDAPVSLENYALAGAVAFAFPAGAAIAPGEHVVVAKRAADFPANHAYQIFEWTSGKLADEGEKILLFDPTGLLADFVRYDNHAPWPERDALLGRSLELVSEDLDNHFAKSWQPSAAAGGSPGEPSGWVAVKNPATAATEFVVSPNPTGGLILLEIAFERAGVFNLRGQLVMEKTGAGETALDVSGLPSGAYFLEILAENGARRVGRFVKME